MAADVVAGEIARLDGRLPGLDDKQRAEITQTVRRVVDKLLHAPTVRVKQLAGEPGGAGYADALRNSSTSTRRRSPPSPGPTDSDRERRTEPRAEHERMSTKALRLGTRRSKLAMAQSGQVAERCAR